jgi:hypothetical protein
MQQILGKSIPRSGHHFLVRIFKGVFGARLKYCEPYRHECCGALPCAKAGAAELALQKSHDFHLDDDAERGDPYLVQYRDPVLSTLSLAENKREQDARFCEEREALEAFLAQKAAYYVGFAEKWLRAERANYVLLDYDELLGDTEAAVARTLARLGAPAARAQIAAALVDLQARHAAYRPRSLQASRFYDEALFSVFESIILERLPFLEAKRKVPKAAAASSSAMYHAFTGHLRTRQADYEAAASAFSRAFERGGSRYFETLSKSRLGDYHWAQERWEEARSCYRAAARHGLHQKYVEKRSRP